LIHLKFSKDFNFLRLNLFYRIASFFNINIDALLFPKLFETFFLKMLVSVISYFLSSFFFAFKMLIYFLENFFSTTKFKLHIFRSISLHLVNGGHCCVYLPTKTSWDYSIKLVFFVNYFNSQIFESECTLYHK